LAISPRVLLLDEPFGALDAKVRKELRRWLRQLHDTVRVTSVFVTHDQEEARELADRVVVMTDGRIEQVGPPEEVYAAPASVFVQEFLGETNRIECRIEAGRVTLSDGTLLGLANAAAGEAIAYVRPYELAVQPTPNGMGIVRRVQYRGALMEVEVLLAGISLDVTLPTAAPPLQAGDRVTVTARRGQVFPMSRQQSVALFASPLGRSCLTMLRR
jgi:sulfate transport system ATP-binding protein